MSEHEPPPFVPTPVTQMREDAEMVEALEDQDRPYEWFGWKCWATELAAHLLELTDRIEAAAEARLGEAVADIADSTGVSAADRVISSHEVRQVVADGYDDWRELVRAAVTAYERKVLNAAPPSTRKGPR